MKKIVKHKNTRTQEHMKHTELFCIQKEVYTCKENCNEDIIHKKEEYIFFLLFEFPCLFNCLRRLLFEKTRAGGFLWKKLYGNGYFILSCMCV